METLSSVKSENAFYAKDASSLSAMEMKEFVDRMLNRIHVVKNRKLFHNRAERKNINQLLSEFKKM